MKNVHERLFAHPIEALRPWIERAWSATDEDVFPRDRIATWRRNPPGAAPFALIVGTTRLGHGPFAFTLRAWDGLAWRVELSNGRGWHGFDLEARGEQTLLRHTLEADLGRAREAMIVPVHDWAVESLFDRLEAALATGHVPLRTERPMGLRAAVVFRGLSLVRRSRRAA